MVSTYRRRRQWRSSLVTSLRMSVSVYSSSTNYKYNTSVISLKPHQTQCAVVLLKHNRDSTLSMVSASAPCSFSQSVSCLSGSWSAGMWKIEGGEMSVNKKKQRVRVEEKHKQKNNQSVNRCVYLVVCV